MTENLLTAATRLADVLDRENSALAALDLPLAAGMLGEKHDAARAFAAVQDAAGATTADDRGRLVGMARRLHALAAENQMLLERALHVQTRVVGIIARAIRPAVVSPRYRATGRLTASARPAAITFSARV